MSIYIGNMDMPKERESFTLTIKYNGLVLDTETGMQVAEAQEVPPHGRLIDTEAKVKTQLYDDEHEEWSDEVELTVEQYLGYCFNEVPTIIPAEEGEA